MIAPDIAGVTVLDEIGRGGFSIVYRAEQPGFSRTVAVKVFSLDPTDTVLVETFLAEARNIGELAARPDVVTVYETGLDSIGRPYLLLQYLPGGSLAERLRVRGTLTVSEAVSIGSMVAGVLIAAHDQGILHCDLKPANVLFDASDQPVLADFGIARATAAADSSRSMAFITPDHAAPELWEGRPPTVATDLYALGSMLHQLLVGRAPFQDPTGARLPPLQVMRRVLADPAPPILRPDAPPRLAQLIHQLLEKDPADRPATASEVFERLSAIEQTFDVGTVQASTTGPATTVRSNAGTGPPVIAPMGSEQIRFAPGVEDDRTRRRAHPIAPAAASPGSSSSPDDFGDGEPSSRTRVSPVAVAGVAVTVVAIVIAAVVWPRGDGSGERSDGRSSKSSSARVVDDQAPTLVLGGDAQRDGATRILAGTMTGPEPWFASLTVTEAEPTGSPIGLAVVGGDSTNRIEVSGSGPNVRLFVSEMTDEDGETMPLPDRRLCFRSMPDDPTVDPTTVCDPAG